MLGIPLLLLFAAGHLSLVNGQEDIKLPVCDELKEYYIGECKTKNDTFVTIAKACMNSDQSKKLIKEWTEKGQFTEVSPHETIHILQTISQVYHL